MGQRVNGWDISCQILIPKPDVMPYHTDITFFLLLKEAPASTAELFFCARELCDSGTVVPCDGKKIG